MLYRRGGIWWFKFRFAGRQFRESARTSSKALARIAERKRRQTLEEGLHGYRRQAAPLLFSVAAEEWLRLKKPTLAARSFQIEETNLRKHLKPVFGSLLMIDITAEDLADYQGRRLEAGAAAKTINLELGTLRAIFRRHRLWANLQPDVRMLAADNEIGKAISAPEEKRLLRACEGSRSRLLLPVVVLALNTGMRRGEIQGLTWRQVDFLNSQLVVGRSKTKAGTGRLVPMNDSARKALEAWATSFPDRKPSHYVFPSERYGLSGNARRPVVHSIDPEQPVGNLKEAWETAKAVAGVHCRFHDLRHTACTRMVERGVPLPVVASLLGWSAATTVRMARRYGHISQSARMDAVGVLEAPTRTAGSSWRLDDRA